MYILETGTP